MNETEISGTKQEKRVKVNGTKISIFHDKIKTNNILFVFKELHR